MLPTTLWPVVGSFGAAAGTLALGYYLWSVRDRPGATWLLVVLGVQFALTAGYGVGYLVSGYWLRWAVEALFWVAYIWLGALFIAFALAYTGRGHVIRSPWFTLLAGLTVLLTLLVVTNPVHELVWADFAVRSTWGLSTASFTRRGGAFLILGVTSIGTAVGTLLLVDTIISYGDLYRGEALAVALSPLPPGIGLIAWTFGVVPAPGINVAPVLFLAHVAFDAYAFVGSGMFDFHPATRRAGNRAAIADLGNPVVIVDERHRVVNYNPAAESTLGLAARDVLTEPFTACYEGDEIDPTETEQDATIRTDAGRRTFKVTSTDLDDGTGAHLGYTLVFQDITAERQREQRLAVLNRVLRHNLRNDLTVVDMNLDAAADRADDDVAELLEPAREKTQGLVSLSEKARSFERVIEDDTESLVAARDVVGEVVAELREEFPEATVDIEGTDAALLRINPALLQVVVRNLVENALEHGRIGEGTAASDGGDADGTAPDVTVSVGAEDDTVTVTVRDRGPGVPDHELAVIEDGDETDLQHGSGLGLWLVTWSVSAAGGDVDFDVTDAGTTATVRFPVVGVDSAAYEATGDANPR
ncbi:histidine kinase N-terminal 7TM domain-containing protein [Halorientalis regularis]|uniref:histidine kinase n=1 Tax=Halorientalis regularis TaxID=660518 RepID=A0A1G7J9I3_9EURY|nr:histidine kinase N-terminal 7TM domain-containing protein [Halorientalis regularis]SDF21536.1 PAS fold [Halorientalis regularis]